MKYFPRLLLRGKFRIVEVGDEVTAICIDNCGNDFNGVVVLKNESTRFMFEKLQYGITMPELISECLKKYTDSKIDEVGPQVLKFLDMLKEKNLLSADLEHGIKIEES